MLSHLSFGVNDLSRAASFYDQILAPLGYVRLFTRSQAVGFGEEGGEHRLSLLAKPGQVVPPGPGFHLAFAAPSHEAVDAFHAAALAAGGRDCGSPGLRLNYGPTYYAAFVIDLDGYKLEAQRQTLEFDPYFDQSSEASFRLA
jgi:catechol 2,3-dioxygenase-like lactoylglutathione lyase family enzyme